MCVQARAWARVEEVDGQRSSGLMPADVRVLDSALRLPATCARRRRPEHEAEGERGSLAAVLLTKASGKISSAKVTTEEGRRAGAGGRRRPTKITSGKRTMCCPWVYFVWIQRVMTTTWTTSSAATPWRRRSSPAGGVEVVLSGR